MKNNFSFIVIIANYNGEKFLINCLNSLVRTNHRNFKVCIVDDGSTDSSLDIIEKYKHTLNLEILNQDHGGASKARNKAILKFQDDYDVIVFLDNDTEVDSQWLVEIEKFFIANKEISGVQCLLVDFEHRSKIQSNGIKLIPHVGWGISIQAGKELSELSKDNQYCAAISAGLAIKSDVIKKIGLFDELLSVSTEDLDFTWRIWVYGFKISNCPSSIVFHHTKKLEDRKDMNVNLYSQYFNITKNSTRTLIKNYSFTYLIWYLPQSIFINFIRAVLVLIRRKDSSSFLAFITAIFWNLYHLPDSLHQRVKIQNNRKFSDKYIYNTIMTPDSLRQIYEKNFKQTNLL